MTSRPSLCARLLLFACLLLASAAVPTLPAHANAVSTADARRAIQRAYDDASAAAARRDADGWLASKADGFVSVGLDGKEVNLATRRALLKMLLSTVKTVKASTTVRSLHLDSTAPNGAVIAVARIHEHVVMTFNRLNSKRVSTLVTDTDAESTWAMTASGWREIRCRSLREKGTLDGKPLAGVTR